MKNEKGFDSVKMMCEIRDKLSKKFVNMNYKDQKKYLEVKNVKLQKQK
jgi:hypothetical protein